MQKIITKEQEQLIANIIRDGGIALSKEETQHKRNRAVKNIIKNASRLGIIDWKVFGMKTFTNKK